MGVHEIAMVDPALMLFSEEFGTIPVGTMAVIPHVDPELRQQDDQRIADDLASDEISESKYPIPEGTILLAGQILSREMYTELSPVYPDGGYYNFPLPNLIKKFIIGFNVENNEILWGDGVVYYESIPKPVKTGHKDIRYD